MARRDQARRQDDRSGPPGGGEEGVGEGAQDEGRVIAARQACCYDHYSEFDTTRLVMSHAAFEQVLIGIQSLLRESLAQLLVLLYATSECERRLETSRDLALGEEE